MNKTQAQRIIREASPGFLASNPPIGTLAALQKITNRLTPVEFRKPFARIPDEKDDWQDCELCAGEGEIYSSQSGFDITCPECKGDRHRPYKDNEVFVTVYRNGHSIETLARVKEDGDVKAWVNVYEPGFLRNSKIELTSEEKDLALQAVKEARE